MLLSQFTSAAGAWAVRSAAANAVSLFVSMKSSAGAIEIQAASLESLASIPQFPNDQVNTTPRTVETGQSCGQPFWDLVRILLIDLRMRPEWA
jgi:hypothetical protein